MEFKKIKSRVTSVRLLLAFAIGLLLYFAHVAFIPVALALLIFPCSPGPWKPCIAATYRVASALR
jgi:hypothetical protein